jgi:hypothetical protein
MSVSFLISQAKSVQKVIDENSAEIELLDQKNWRWRSYF